MKIEDWLKLAKRKIDGLDAELIAVKVFAPCSKNRKVDCAEGALEVAEGDLSWLTPKVDRSWLVAHGDEAITAEQLELAEEMVCERAKGRPLAYILGEKEFYGRRFVVDPDVLIPRPETEVLIDLVKEVVGTTAGVTSEAEALGDLVKENVKEPLGARSVRVLEVGTGSGCIAVTLAQELRAKVLAVDISEKALVVARQNSRLYGDRVEFRRSDLLSRVADEEGFDVIVANLPYVDREWEWLEKESLGYEPELALYAEKAGLGLYERLFEQIWERNRRQKAISEVNERGDENDGGDRSGVFARYVVVEADPCQHEELKKLGRQYGLKCVKIEGYGVVFRTVDF